VIIIASVVGASCSCKDYSAGTNHHRMLRLPRAEGRKQPRRAYTSPARRNGLIQAQPNTIGPIQARILAAPLVRFPLTVAELDRVKMALRPCRLHRDMLGLSRPIEEISLILLET
jgi:hypothetical protein